MRTRLLWILLAASMVLNIAIMGGILYTRHGGGPWSGGPDRAVERLSDKLELSSDQQARLREVVMGAMERRKARRDSPPPQRQALIDQLGADQFDEDEVRRLLGELSAERNVQWLAVTRDMHAFVATLDAEQKSEFLRLAKDRGFFRKLFRPSKRGRD